VFDADGADGRLKMTSFVQTEGAFGSADRRRTAIIIVNWNGWRDCVECLSSIVGGGLLSEADVWLVDNDSADQSLEHIARWCSIPYVESGWTALPGVVHADPGLGCIPCRIWEANGSVAPAEPGIRLHLVRSGGNLGFAGGNNCGMTAAGPSRYDHFWLLNSDTVVDSHALSELTARLDLDPGVGMVGSTLLYYARPGKVQAQGGGHLDEALMQVRHIGDMTEAADLPHDSSALAQIEARMSYVVGASLLVSTDLVRAVGMMCDDYFLYFEEIDWAFRARDRYRLAYASKSRVYHKVGASSSSVKSEFSLNLLYRNQVRFAARFLPQRLGALRRSLSWELVRHVLKGRLMQAKLVARTLADFDALVKASVLPRASADR
jgi:GT2 family glycosyltransferase